MLDDARAMSRQQIHAILCDGFRRRGYALVETHANQSVDLILRRDGERFLVDCRQWKSATVREKAVRQLIAELVSRDAAGGLLLTTGTFSDEARDLAKEAGVELFDGQAIEQLILDARRPEPFLDPTEGRRQTSFRSLVVEPSCPVCGGAMVKRTLAGSGQKAEDFWGCLQPHCRGTRPLK